MAVVAYFLFKLILEASGPKTKIITFSGSFFSVCFHGVVLAGSPPCVKMGLWYKAVYRLSLSRTGTDGRVTQNKAASSQIGCRV